MVLFEGVSGIKLAQLARYIIAAIQRIQLSSSPPPSALLIGT